MQNIKLFLNNLSKFDDNLMDFLDLRTMSKINKMYFLTILKSFHFKIKKFIDKRSKYFNVVKFISIYLKTFR